MDDYNARALATPTTIATNLDDIILHSSMEFVGASQFNHSHYFPTSRDQVTDMITPSA